MLAGILNWLTHENKNIIIEVLKTYIPVLLNELESTLLIHLTAHVEYRWTYFTGATGHKRASVILKYMKWKRWKPPTRQMWKYYSHITSTPPITGWIEQTRILSAKFVCIYLSSPFCITCGINHIISSQQVSDI
jgi:hypothetical protein